MHLSLVHIARVTKYEIKEREHNNELSTTKDRAEMVLNDRRRYIALTYTRLYELSSFIVLAF